MSLFPEFMCFNDYNRNLRKIEVHLISEFWIIGPEPENPYSGKWRKNPNGRLFWRLSESKMFTTFAGTNSKSLLDLLKGLKG